MRADPPHCAGQPGWRRGVCVEGARSAAGRADRRPLLPGGRSAVLPVAAAGGACAVAHRQPRGAVPHPRRHRRRRRGVRRRLRGHHAHAAWEFSYPTPTRSVGVHVKPWGLAPSFRCPRPSCATDLRRWSRSGAGPLSLSCDTD